MKLNIRFAALNTLFAVFVSLAWTRSDQSSPTFAGWVRSSKCSIQVRTGKDGSATKLTQTQATSRRLYAGQYVKADGPGLVQLLIYGHEKPLTSAQGWYPVPNDPAKAPAGKDVYAEYTSRAGLPRGGSVMPENLWRALSLTDLENPHAQADLKVKIRIVPLAADDSGRKSVPTVSGKICLQPGERIAVEISNDSPFPLYMSVMDIDSEGAVVRLSPQTSEGQYPVPPHMQWARLPVSFRLGLPQGWTEGVEHLKVVASTKPIDLSVLETKRTVPATLDMQPANDPLINLMRAASGQSAMLQIGSWTSAGTDFLIRYSS